MFKKITQYIKKNIKYFFIFFILKILILVGIFIINKNLFFSFLGKNNNINIQHNVNIGEVKNTNNKKEKKEEINNETTSLITSNDNNLSKKNNIINNNFINNLAKRTEDNVNNTIDSVIILNHLTLSDKPYIKYLNTYINNLKIQGLNDYKFYLLKRKNNNLSNCGNNFIGEEKTSFDIFNITKNIDYIEAIRVFKKISLKDKTAKLFIIGDSLSTICNNDLNISGLKKEIGSDNINIYIIGISNLNDKNDIIKDNFFKKLSLELGIQYLKIKSPGDFSSFINSKIYPLESGNNDLINQTINTEILFFDSDGNPTSASTIVYQKKGSVFKKYGEYINDGILQLSLLPGIYYFEMVDNLKGIKVKTEPKTINDTLKYKNKIFFRKTKLNINILDEQKEPILSDITIKDLNNGGFIIKEVKKTSSLIEELNPGKYEIEIKTFDKFIFNDVIDILGQINIDKEYLTKKGKVEINVKNEVGNIKNDVIIKIYNQNNEQVFVGNGGKNIVELYGGTYNINVEDVTSGNFIKNTFTLSANNPNESVDIIFKSVQVTLDIGNTPKMLRFYYDKDYLTLPDDINEKRKLAFKSISGSGKMKINLMLGNYVIDIFDFNNQYIGTKKISVDDMNSSTFTLYD